MEEVPGCLWGRPRQEAESHSTDEPPSCPDDRSCSEFPGQERHQGFTVLKTRMSRHSFSACLGVLEPTGKVFFLTRYVNS